MGARYGLFQGEIKVAQGSRKEDSERNLWTSSLLCIKNIV